MKKLLLGIAGLVAFAAPASAADLAARPYTKAPPPAIAMVYDWSGFYIGGNGGWGTSHACWDALNINGVFTNSNGCHDASGGTAGGQIGYRWQAGTWVFGLEGQGNWANFGGRNVSPVDPTFTGESKIRAFGLLTGQIGYAWNNVLLYVKGGAAVTDTSYNAIFTPTNTTLASVSDTRWGGTIGAGLEFGFAPNWSAGVEYNHLFMGTNNQTFTSNGIAAPVGTVMAKDRISQDADIVTVRVNYRWGGPAVARY